jgi:hypothetical protein
MGDLNLENTKNVKFRELVALCEKYFGAPRIRGSHHIFKMPWPGDPRINLQADGKMAKPYQVKAVKEALERLRSDKRD